jgi:hypothetical protein
VLTRQQLLGQRGPRVRQVALIANHDQLTVEPGGARGLAGSQPGQRCSNDDETMHQFSSGTC